jgi:hypothetical protein
MFFAIVTVVTIFIIIVAQILLSVSVQSGAYEIAGLQRNVKELGRTYQSATQDLNRVTSPQNVAQSAETLGMVGNSNPVYLRLSDSLITGAATPAVAGGALIAQGNLVPNAMLAEELQDAVHDELARAGGRLEEQRDDAVLEDRPHQPGHAHHVLEPVVQRLVPGQVRHVHARADGQARRLHLHRLLQLRLLRLSQVHQHL